MTSMTVMGNGGELLKIDTLGRVRTSRARREAILDEFERSGGSGLQFAALLGIKYPTFASWIQGRRRQRRLVESGGEADFPPSAGAGPVWLEAVLENGSSPDARTLPAGASEGSLQVRLPGGVEVGLTHAGQVPLLARLLRELELGHSLSC